MARFTKDAAVLDEVTRISAERVALIRSLITVICDWPKVILQNPSFDKLSSKTANHWSKPPFRVPVYLKYFRRFALVT
jgi:hypothetical protein